jgi:Chalcone isomerase-like
MAGRPTLVTLAILCCVLAAPRARVGAAAEIEGVRFADRVQVGQTALVLAHVGLLRYRYFIKAYVAALYLGDGVSPDRLFDDVPKRLEIEYFYAIKAPGFAQATDDGIAANASPATVARLRPRIARLNALYEDVTPGDRYALTYLPGVGTELALNGKRRGVVEGADFAAAVFGIWLGRRPIDASLKAQLLGGS